MTLGSKAGNSASDSESAQSRILWYFQRLFLAMVFVFSCRTIWSGGQASFYGIYIWTDTKVNRRICGKAFFDGRSL